MIKRQYKIPSCNWLSYRSILRSPSTSASLDITLIWPDFFESRDNTSHFFQLKAILIISINNLIVRCNRGHFYRSYEQEFMLNYRSLLEIHNDNTLLTSFTYASFIGHCASYNFISGSKIYLRLLRIHIRINLL